MREILFRGKRVDTGEWVYGFLSKSRNKEEHPSFLKLCIDYEEKGVMTSSIVDPETVGQYTGLTDKNGKKIFEGDIVEYEAGIEGFYNKAKVIWEYCQFKCIDLCNRMITQPAYMDVEFEIIGNDTPEFLEE